MKIDLPISIADGYPEEWTTVRADIVDVAPHLLGTFAVHRSPFAQERGKWAVTHVETGCRVILCPTRGRAVRMAEKFLTLITPQALARAVRKAVKAAPSITQSHSSLPVTKGTT